MSVEADWIDTDKVFNAFSTAADLKELVAAAEDNRLYVAQALRKMLCSKIPPIQEVIDAGFALKCVEWIQCFDSPQLQYESAWVLNNIATGTPSQVRAIVDKGAIPLTVKLLTSSSESVRDQAACVLGNISSESIYYRGLILDAGGLYYLIQSVDKTNQLTMIKNATWALTILCRRRPAPNFEVVKAAIPTLARLFTEYSEQTMLEDIAWAFYDLSFNSEYKAKHLVQCQVVPRMVELMSHNEHKLQLVVIGTVGNLIANSDTHTQVVIDCGVLHQIKRLVHSVNQKVLKEVVWIVSNISAGSFGQIESLISTDVLPDIIQVCRVGSEEVMRYACYVVANVAYKCRENQAQYLTRSGALHLLGNALKANDIQCVLAALRGLECLFAAGKTAGENPYVAAFKETGHLESLLECQIHDSDNIYSQALKLLNTYFPFEEEDDLAAALTRIVRS